MGCGVWGAAGLWAEPGARLQAVVYRVGCGPVGGRGVGWWGMGWGWVCTINAHFGGSPKVRTQRKGDSRRFVIIVRIHVNEANIPRHRVNIFKAATGFLVFLCRIEVLGSICITSAPRLRLQFIIISAIKCGSRAVDFRRTKPLTFFIHFARQTQHHGNVFLVHNKKEDYLFWCGFVRRCMTALSNVVAFCWWSFRQVRTCESLPPP